MLNKLQLWIYYLLAISPIIAISLWPFLPKNILLLVCIYTLIIVMIIIISFKWLKLCKSKIPKEKIIVTSIEPYDIQNLTVILTYMLPLITLLLTPEHKIFYATLIIVSLFIIFTLMNYVLPNPLFLLKYHLYKINIKDSVSGYLLLSRRTLVNVNQVKEVHGIFDYLGVDADV